MGLRSHVDELRMSREHQGSGLFVNTVAKRCPRGRRNMLLTNFLYAESCQVGDLCGVCRDFIGGAEQAAEIIPLPGHKCIAGTVGHADGE